MHTLKYVCQREYIFAQLLLLFVKYGGNEKGGKNFINEVKVFFKMSDIAFFMNSFSIQIIIYHYNHNLQIKIYISF